MSKLLGLTGNEAVAYAMKQIDPDVVAAYPITPQTAIVQKFSEYVADGKVNTELVCADSEHSAMSATIGASAAGARAMTATASNGLAYMIEVVYIAASCRLPIVMPVVNRALAGPINIHCDHSDAMSARDSGWIQLFSENAQEAYENTLMALRIAEDPSVLTPIMVCLDGFIISHCVDTVTVYDDKLVKEFLGSYAPKNPLLDDKNPVTYGPLDFFNFYYEHKRQQVDGMESSRQVILDVGREFATKMGTETTSAFFDTYQLEDAEVAIIVMGSTAGNTRVVVDAMRADGHKVGLVKLRTYRPFPGVELAKALAHVKVVGVMDRAASLGAMGGPLYSDMTAALFAAESKTKLANLVYGLGGREINLEMITQIFNRLEKINQSGEIGQTVEFVGVRN